jgi:levanase/fructan beta-fructosidase
MKKFLIIHVFLLFYVAIVLAQESKIPTPQWRPVYHFTPLKNWTNDPNGLLYINGVYHLYNQQNPYENKWGHMSWGHATSTDLVHWKHLPIALPETIDKDTTWRFSGSAVLDVENKSGLCARKNCIVAIYTADQPNLKKESQYIAYSNDGGTTFTNYSQNPVIDLNLKDFRDPNVFWYQPSAQWIMTVALPTQHKVRFYGSKDLKSWTLLSEFGPQGYVNAAWECPFLIQLAVDNHPQNKKWVLFNSAGGGERGTYMQYFVGDFDGTSFKNDNPPDSVLTVDYGDCFYAAIPWNNLSEDKKIYIGWMVPEPQETYPWRGQMSIPRDLGLTKTKEGIRLVQHPTSLIKGNLGIHAPNKPAEIRDLKLSDKEVLMNDQLSIKGNAYWLEVELMVDATARAGFRIAQKKDQNNKTVSETEIGYDAAKKQIYVDRSRIGNAKIKPGKEVLTFSLPTALDTIRLELLFDRSSLEVFVNNGEQVLTTYTFPEDGGDGIAAFASNGNAVITRLKAWDLSGMKSE